MSNDLDELDMAMAHVRAGDACKAAACIVRHLRSHPAPPPSPSEENGGEASDEEPSPRNPSKHPDQRDGQCGMVSHDEAKDIALAYIDKAFNNPERPGRVRIRHTIPASYRDNTDLRLCAYIDQQKRQASADAATIAGFADMAHVIADILGDDDGEAGALARELEVKIRRAMRYTPALDSIQWKDSPASLRPEPGGGK